MSSGADQGSLISDNPAFTLPPPTPSPGPPVPATTSTPAGQARRGFDKVCEACQSQYTAKRPHSRWCPDCRRAAYRRLSAAWARDRYARDPAFRERQRVWVKAHPERIKAAQDKHHKRPCPRCGLVRQTYVTGKEAKDRQLCQKCSALARRQMVWLRCYWCRGVFMRRRRNFNEKARRAWCQECYGIMTRVAPLLGVTRERLRQLVNKEYARLNRGGHWATRAEALASVMTARRAGNA